MSDIAPDFTLRLSDTNGSDGQVTLSDLRGAPVVLFFYPRDMTAGCIKEAQAFSSRLEAFEAAGAKVFGISADSSASHEKFISKKALNVPLLSDENAEVCTAYGVWKEKKMYGKTFMGIERSTFLIDADGAIVREWRKVKVDGHEAEVLAALEAL
ncbi:MAG: peroxiredoxin [Pelagimonas sp.]|jgi:peroxiredoxin Q/BCP|nr:peroxiredoxin [Pelagimonas sp.]